MEVPSRSEQVGQVGDLRSETSMESSQSRAEAGKLRNGLASKWFRLLGIMCLSHLLGSAIVAQKQYRILYMNGCGFVLIKFYSWTRKFEIYLSFCCCLVLSLKM